jgi:hypothetical protein
MLEHVALGQTRFNMPGVAPDGRGILLGKLGALSFPSIDRLVTFFRLFCLESSIDDLSPRLRIEEVQSQLQVREYCVFLQAGSSHLLDRVARLCRVAGGHVFTGSTKHFVCYRDEHSPFGYDLTTISAESGADYLFYADTYTQAYARQKELPFSDLVFRLSPRVRPGHDEEERELLYLTVPAGLGQGLSKYLWRNTIRADATLVEPSEVGSFGRSSRFYLFRVHDLPLRMLRLFSKVPGIVVFRPVGDRCAVEAGFRHPFRLEACGSLFEKGRLYLFSARDGVKWVNGPFFIPLAELVDIGFQIEERVPVEHRSNAAQTIQIALRLRPSHRRQRLVGTMVSWESAHRFKKLVYLLPPPMLDGLRLFAMKEGLLVIGEQGVEGVPIGEPFQELAPGILVPLGLTIEPRVRAEVLVERLGGVAGRYIVFLRDGRVLGIEEAHFQPLGKTYLARLELEPPSVDPRLRQEEKPKEAIVLNENAGLFPLWGFLPK